MSFYETLYIVDPNLENNTLDKTMDEIGKQLTKTKSKIINHRTWGKKRLAYPIERQKYGSYIILQFEGGGNQSKMSDYDTWMRLNNSVLRHITVLLNEKPALYVDDSKSDSTDTDKKTNENASESNVDDKDPSISDSKADNKEELELQKEEIESREVE